MHLFSHLSELQTRHMTWLGWSAARLLLAAALGGVVGLERTIHRKPAGIRTNMFICLGAAMFTIMSDAMPDPTIGDRTRIASNIVQGVGFLGAGAILHSKGGISGLTTAATMWVVASIGIAAGDGRYLLATIATIIILVALSILDAFEAKAGLKLITTSYEIKGPSAPEILEDVNRILDESHHAMKHLQVGRSQNVSRVSFTVTCTLSEHEKLQAQLRTEPKFESVATFNPVVEE